MPKLFPKVSSPKQRHANIHSILLRVELCKNHIYFVFCSECLTLSNDLRPRPTPSLGRCLAFPFACFLNSVAKFCQRQLLLLSFQGWRQEKSTLQNRRKTVLVGSMLVVDNGSVVGSRALLFNGGPGCKQSLWKIHMCSALRSFRISVAQTTQETSTTRTTSAFQVDL